MSSMNTNINTSGGQPYPAQAILALVVLAVMHILYFSTEYLYRLMKNVSKTQTDLIPFTATSSKMYSFAQDPADGNSKSIYLSDNERTGAEFTYSFFMYVDPTCFGTEDGLLHIFHKGYSSQYPLLGPGVYMHNNKNTLRVYMNTFGSWNTYIDVEGFPVKKWVHVALVCEENGMNIFINGNIAKRLNFGKSLPYQNFQNISVFSQRRIVLRGSTIPSLNGVDLNIMGSLRGSISLLTYFSYAISYTELNDILQGGPSTKVDPDSQDKPPYLTDDWWVTSQ